MKEDDDDCDQADCDFHAGFELTKDFEISLDDEGDYEIIKKDD